MTNKTYFNNFFVALCASMNDDEFLAFAEAALANLKHDPASDAADIAFLEPLITALRAAHGKRGVGGKSATAASLRAAVREFLAWAKLTNVQKVFPAFPDRNQPERIAIFPGGMDALYRADQTNILSRAKYYLDKISSAYGAQTGITADAVQQQYAKLETALTGRTTEVADLRGASAAVDEQELAVCGGLYRAYAGLLHRFFAQPGQAYAYFPFPDTTGAAADGNLSGIPKPHPTDA